MGVQVFKYVYLSLVLYDITFLLKAYANLSNILSKCLTMFDGMFDVRIATSSNIIDKIRKLQSSYQSLLILMTKNQLEAQQEVG